jgi:methionyl-tRNA synthetase
MTTPRTYYVTTPIYYVNAAPHVGHAYTTIAADTLTRARRLQGKDAYFLTGTDEHGQNIERIARERGIPEQQHCDEFAARFQALWTRLDIRYDRFIRTTQDVHKRGVLKFWDRLYRAKTPDGQDAVYRGKYAGWYCPRCEAFKDEEELRQPDNVCAIHELPCEWTEEENFFFRLSAYTDWLKAEIESGKIRIDPEARRNEVLATINGGLKDFSASRARVKWGIPLPQQPDHVLYVWTDALLNYITALGYDADAPEYRKYWEGDGERFQLIGKDIIRFHCIYWPALLHAAGLPAPNRLFAQGFITKDGRKLSKTTGNVIDPEELVERLGPDAVRYFLLREGVYGQDWDYTDAAFVGRYNADLANDLGNLASRALTMVARYCEGKVPARPALPPDDAEGFEGLLQRDLEQDPPETDFLGDVFERYERLDFAGALSAIWTWIGRLNQRIVAEAPWEKAKDAAKRPELEAFLYRLLEAVRIVGVAVYPVIPRSAARLFAALGLETREPSAKDLEWGVLAPGASLGTIEPLFPRVEKPAAPRENKETRMSETPAGPPPAPAAPAAAPAGADGRIDIADFAKVDLRVARIKAAEKIAGSKKLVKLEVDLGTETRQVVAGIAESYAPEALVGKTIALVANLKPAKLMGVESNGMILAASPGDKAVLCTFEGDVAPGTKIK